MTQEDGGRVDTRLGREIGVRWRRPGPPVGRPRPAPIGSVARASSRFVQGWGRPVTVRRALAGPSSVPTASTSDLQTRPPRWWSGESPLVAEAPERLSLRPERGLRQVVRPLPEPSDARPTGAWVSSAPTVVPMRLPDEVAAVGRITTSADARSRRLTAPSREAPGFSGGTETSPAADRAVPQGSVSPTSATTSTAPAPRSAPGMARVLRRKATATRASHAAVAEAARRTPKPPRQSALSPAPQSHQAAPLPVEQGRQARVEASAGLDTLAGARYSTGGEADARHSTGDDDGARSTGGEGGAPTGGDAGTPSPLPMVIRRVLGTDRPSAASTALAADPLRRSVAAVGRATRSGTAVPTGSAAQLAVAPDVRGVAALTGGRDGAPAVAASTARPAGSRTTADQTIVRRSPAVASPAPSAPPSAFAAQVLAANRALSPRSEVPTASSATAAGLSAPVASRSSSGTAPSSAAAVVSSSVPAVSTATGAPAASSPALSSSLAPSAAATAPASSTEPARPAASAGSAPAIGGAARAAGSPPGHAAPEHTASENTVLRQASLGLAAAEQVSPEHISPEHAAFEPAVPRVAAHRGLGIERPSLRHEPVLRRSVRGRAHGGTMTAGAANAGAWSDVAAAGAGSRRSWASGPAAAAALGSAHAGRGQGPAAAGPDLVRAASGTRDRAAMTGAGASAAAGSHIAVTLAALPAGAPGAVLRRSVATDAPQIATYRRRSGAATPPRPLAWQDGRVPGSPASAGAPGAPESSVAADPVLGYTDTVDLGLPGGGAAPASPAPAGTAAPAGPGAPASLGAPAGPAGSRAWLRDPDIARPTHPWAVQPPRSPAAPSREQGHGADAATPGSSRGGRGAGAGLGGLGTGAGLGGLGAALGGAVRSAAGRRGAGAALGSSRPGGGASPSSSTGSLGGAMFETTFPAPGGVVGGAARQAAGAGAGASDDTPSADLVARVASKVQESVQDDLRRWLDRELEVRVRGVVDERIVAETERRAWRRGAEVF